MQPLGHGPGKDAVGMNVNGVQGGSALVDRGLTGQENVVVQNEPDLGVLDLALGPACILTRQPPEICISIS